MYIRKAIIEDYEEMVELVREVHKLHVEHRPDVYVDSDIPLEMERFEGLLKDEKTEVFCAVLEDGGLIGYGIVKVISTGGLSIVVPQRFGYIDDFCIKSQYRNQGIGKQLFNYIADYTRNNGASSLQLNVWAFNEDAIAFYERMGMRTRNIRLEMALEA